MSAQADQLPSCDVPAKESAFRASRIWSASAPQIAKITFAVKAVHQSFGSPEIPTTSHYTPTAAVRTVRHRPGKESSETSNHSRHRKGSPPSLSKRRGMYGGDRGQLHV